MNSVQHPCREGIEEVRGELIDIKHLNFKKGTQGQTFYRFGIYEVFKGTD